MDMAGNVWEWTADWYLPYPGALYQSEDFGWVFRVVRGGGNSTDLSLQMRTAVRLHYPPDTALSSIGFRCAQGGSAPTPQPTYTPEPTAAPDPTLLAQRDTVLVPAGEFIMGDNEGHPDAQPEHVVYLDAFYIDRLEVTNAQYAAFLNEIGQNQWACSGVDCASVTYGKGGTIYYEGGQFKVAEGRENFPAGFVSWYGADAYCHYYGMRLPTEAEWEKAARGTDGRKWPWGDEWDPDKVATAGDRPVDPLPVGSRPEGASPYGALDMIGNVNEWTNDWYGADYYQESPYRNPPGPAAGTGRVVRGAGSMNTRTSRWDRIAGTAMRTHGTPDIAHSGFRCVYDAGEEDR
jgi:sulfatase modifying factor 1